MYYFMAEKRERVNAIALGKFLKRQRLLRKMSQAEVAERIGKQQGQIAKLESGRTATVPLDDVEMYAQGVGSTRLAALRAIKHPSVTGSDEPFDATEEEAVAIAEAYKGYQTQQAKDIIRQALAYADQIEKGSIIGGTRSE